MVLGCVAFGYLRFPPRTWEEVMSFTVLLLGLVVGIVAVADPPLFSQFFRRREESSFPLVVIVLTFLLTYRGRMALLILFGGVVVGVAFTSFQMWINSSEREKEDDKDDKDDEGGNGDDDGSNPAR